MRISNFNPVMLKQGIRLTSGKNPYTDVYLLNNNTVFKYLKTSAENNLAYGMFYNTFCAKLNAASKLQDIAELVLPEEVSVDAKKYVKGFSYQYVNLPDLASFFSDTVTMDEVTGFYIALSELTDRLYDRKVIVPDLITSSNLLYDKENKKIRLIDYDGMQIENIPTNVISHTLRYKQNPVLRSSKYFNCNGTYTKEINTMSLLVDYLYRLTGINVADNPDFQGISSLEANGMSLDKVKDKIRELFNSIGIDDKEIVNGYINVFSAKQDNPEAKKLIKRFANNYQSSFNGNKKDER